MQYSNFGQKFDSRSGITQLMDDLNEGLGTPEAIMLGGGNPATIPEMEAYLRKVCAELLAQGALTKAIGNYDGPQGQDAFIQSLAAMLCKNYGWPIGPQNITVTNGSQSSFFYLFNILAGRQADGGHKKILLPLSPEYIGYTDLGLEQSQGRHILASRPPKLEFLGERLFKYHVNFEQLHIDDSIAAICVSRPTNPTGNVLTDEEVQRLDELAHAHKIPLILDNAYGMPFPNIIFTEAKPFWNENTILCLSLSKLGLPGLRCGIVVASEAITRVLTNMNGIISLAPGSLGPVFGRYMIESGDLLELSHNVVQPFYRQKSQLALNLVRELLPDERVLIHRPEGAMFLWLWFRNLPISATTLYHRLKARGVFIVPGEFFFAGTPEHQCLRMNYVQNLEQIRKGVQIMAEEVEKAYGA